MNSNQSTQLNEEATTCKGRTLRGRGRSPMHRDSSIQRIFDDIVPFPTLTGDYR
jgi:hypothetical protein